ncbi:MAG: RHS repeat-associated core domain-containing protein [Bacteroidota bacterium]
MIKATDYIGSLILENDTLQFIQTAEGRVVPRESDWEYQYHLKDHLGNVRTTFTSDPKTESYNTSFETATVPDGYFDNYEEQHRDDYTANTGTYSSRLSYDDNLLIGLAKSLKVYPGDTVKATAHARVLDNSTEDIGDLFATLASGFSGAFANTTLGIEGQTTNISDLVYPASGTGGLLDKDENDDTPKLYLNLLYFDKDMNFITGDFARTSTAAATSFEKLSLEVLVPMEGYMLIYVSNEEDQKNIAYFDDVSIEHNHSPVLQADDYYPFGLTFNSYQRSYSKANNFKYNGKEEQEETGWYDYGVRNYDAAVGRFFNQDRFAEKYLDFSPYQYAANNPILYIDVNGDSLDVGGDMQQSFNAILSFILKRFRDRFSYDSETGSVGFNKEGLKTKKDGSLRNSTLNFMDAVVSDSDVNILFEVTEETVVQEGTPKISEQTGGTFNVSFNKIGNVGVNTLNFPDHSFSNFLKFGRSGFENIKSGFNTTNPLSENLIVRIPQNNYDGQAAIHPGLRSGENNGRARITKHVIGEAYYKAKGFRDSHRRAGDGAFDFNQIYFKD